MKTAEIKIDKNIPLPPNANTSGLAVTLRKLQIGESFLFTPASAANLHSSAKQVGIKIATRKQPNGQYRIWKIQ